MIQIIFIILAVILWVCAVWSLARRNGVGYGNLDLLEIALLIFSGGFLIRIIGVYDISSWIMQVLATIAVHLVVITLALFAARLFARSKA